jgi:hypothetical protein
MSISFKRKFVWSVLPFKREVDDDISRKDAALYEAHFRWFRKSRVAEMCLPWRLGQELGWLIPSPVDVAMAPVRDIEIVHGIDAELHEAASTMGATEVWKRDKCAFATTKTDWLRLYDFRVEDRWESMFILNGQGTVEWRLGWELHLPAKKCAFIFSDGVCDGMEVPSGVLTESMLKRSNEERGFSIAVKPTRSIQISRGQPVARLIVLPQECLTEKAEPQVN